MKLHRTSLFVALTIVVLASVAALITGWPGWLFGLLTALVLVALGLRASSLGVPQVVAKEHLSAEVPSSEEEPPIPWYDVAGVRLSSATKGCRFEFAARVLWSPVRPDLSESEARSVAVDALLRRAEAMAESRAADETELAHHSVAARLASPEYDNQRRVRVWAQQVELRLPASDSEYLRRITELRRREVASEINRKIEQEQRAYLRDDVLASPGSTTVWWLNQNLDQVDRAVELFGTFANLSAAAHDRHETTSIGSEAGFGARRDEAALAGLSSIRDEDPTTAPRMGGNASNGWSTAEDASAGTIQVRMDFDAAVERLLDDHPEPERSLKADSLAMLETRFGRPDRADRIRELFDTPGEPSSSSALGDSSSGPTSALPSTVSTTSANPAGAESSAATAPSGADPFEIVEASTDAPTTVQEPHGAAPLTVEDTSRPEAIATVPFTSAADVASTGRPGIEQRAAAEYREQFYSSGESTIVPSDADHPTEESGHSDPNG